MRTRVASDDGMTLVEVVVASAILFFIMTAILGLVSRTTVMSLQAKQISEVNNAVNSYVEWARTLPFTKVSAPPIGSMESTTIPAGDYTVQIVPTVQPGSNNYLKNVTLAVTATRANGDLKVLNTMVIIYDRDQYFTEGTQSALTDPTVAFLTATPPDGTPVWSDATGSWWVDSSGVTRPLVLTVKATATTGRTVDEVYLMGEQSWDLMDTYKNHARWLNPTWTDSPLFYWDLKQATALGEPLVQEGIRSVYAYVKDSAGVVRYEMRQFCVDNLPPSTPPTPIQHDPAGSMPGTLFWPLVWDGTSPAWQYQLGIRQQPLAPTTTIWQWPLIAFHFTSQTAYSPASDPMSRYAVVARARSPRELYGPWGDWTEYITRPQITGTYAIEKQTSGSSRWWKVTPSLTASAPTFDATGTVYAWYEGSSLLATTTVNTYVAPSVTVLSDPSVTPFPARTYYVSVSTIPLGWNSTGASVTRKSNVVTTLENVTGTYTFGPGVW